MSDEVERELGIGNGLQDFELLPSKNDLDKTASEIKERGGSPIPIQLDHNNDLEVEQFFERVKNEQKGQLDLLGNRFMNVLLPICGIKSNGVSLRNHYLCTVYASRIMVENRTGLIVNISSGGGLKYLFNVPYGIGPVKTEEITNRVLENPEARNSAKRTFESGESTEFTGMAIVKLASDPNKIQCTGKILLTSFLARKYDIKDLNVRTIKNLLRSNNSDCN
ncbi:DHRS1 [Lepeophtheirus salmonis]|uniref:DHRS1 n=1 Tax=Lepeophtheirus salmonis TaxID=72036 RepID=A0A817FDS8_LEPSM|nr:DHRS1 [Lepeophtheirus salmonis]CAG9477461.1 DHRS1 [Lepeophtheirus salmonis]